MGEVREDHLLKPGCLICDRLRHHWMTMAMQGDPPAANGVDQGLALLSVQQCTFTGNHSLRWRC